MQDRRIKVLEEKIGKLQKSVGWLTIVCALLLVLPLLALSGWQSRLPDEIRAKKFVVVDNAGRERVALRGGVDGQGLVLTDRNGRVRAGLTIDGDQPGLRMYDRNGKARMGLTLDYDLPGLRLYDYSGRARAGLVINTDGPTLDFLDILGRHTHRYPQRNPQR